MAFHFQNDLLKSPRLRSEGGFSLIEALIAATIIVGFAMSTAFTMNIFNRTASITRNYAAAETIVRDYLDRALNASWTPTETPPILADTSSSGGQVHTGTVNRLTRLTAATPFAYLSTLLFSML